MLFIVYLDLIYATDTNTHKDAPNSRFSLLRPIFGHSTR